MSVLGPNITEQERQEFLLQAMKVTKVSQYVMLAGRTFFMFYWLDNLAEEVEKIWSGEWRTGKILFLLTTYSVLARGLVDLPSQMTFFPMSAQSCWNYAILTQILVFLQTYAPAGSILLTLHALLGAKRKHLMVIITSYCLFMVFAVIMVALGMAGLRAHEAVLPTKLIAPCMFKQDAYVMNTILTYANVAREGIVLIFGGYVVLTRYKRQNDSLIRAIRRDGGAYLVVAFLLGVVAAVLRTPKFPVYDVYGIVQETRLAVYPILANRLLLNLRDTTDYTTRTAVSNILFESSRLEEEQEDNVLEEVFRSGPRLDEPSASGSGTAVAKPGSAGVEGTDQSDGEEDMAGPSTALATGVDRRIPLSSRHNGSMV